MHQLLESGNVGSATQLANAVLETVSQSNTTNSEDRIAVSFIIGWLSPGAEKMDQILPCDHDWLPQQASSGLSTLSREKIVFCMLYNKSFKAGFH